PAPAGGESPPERPRGRPAGSGGGPPTRRFRPPRAPLANAADLAKLQEVVMSWNMSGPAATIRSVPGPNGRLHVTDQPGEGPPLVLLHGFPDDSRIYDQLVPQLTPRRVVALDWLGYGRSERAAPSRLDAGDHERNIGAVLDS